MANLATLGGISEARTELYNKLEAGEIPEQRANIMERGLRGQVELKGTLPLKFIQTMARYKGGTLEGYIAATAGELAGFLDTAKAALKE